MKTYKHSLKLKANPQQVYESLATSKGHTELTGSPAQISETVGGAFSAYDGYITGKNLQLLKYETIEQEWRGDEKEWPKEHFSKVKFSIKPAEGGTQVDFKQEDIPDEAYAKIEQGWEDFYWKPLKKKFSELI